MAYQRKTKDRWDIMTNWGYGWECENSEYTREDARRSFREYEACDLVREKYDNEDIVLGSEDLVSMPRDEFIFQADWYTDEEVQDMEESA